MNAVTPRRPSIKDLTGKKLAQIEQYAIKSTLGRNLATLIYQSSLYTFFKRKFQKFQNIKLEEEIKKYSVPQHVAIIMDGNRRFAKYLDLKPEIGHLLGKEKLEEVIQWCLDLDIKVLTVYAFSTENFHRESKEVQTLMDLCTHELEKARTDSRIHKNKMKVRVIGHIESLPQETQRSAQHIMDETSHYDKYLFNIALAYGGREEIIRAIQHIAQDVKDERITLEDISENTVSTYMYTNGLPDPDLILRTSGEERISNFLLWQLAYSELYFSDVFWPAFQKRDFLKAIQTYQHRKRKFGR